MKKRHLVAINLINLLVIVSYVECIQLDNELVSKPQRKCKQLLVSVIGGNLYGTKKDRHAGYSEQKFLAILNNLNSVTFLKKIILLKLITESIKSLLTQIIMMMTTFSLDGLFPC